MCTNAKDKKQVTKTWVNVHLLKVRDDALFERCDKLAGCLMICLIMIHNGPTSL